jgi:hypothetical protein
MQALENENQRQDFPAGGIRREVEIADPGNSGVSDE